MSIYVVLLTEYITVLLQNTTGRFLSKQCSAFYNKRSVSTRWMYQYCVLIFGLTMFQWTETCRQIFNIYYQFMLCYWLNILLYYWILTIVHPFISVSQWVLLCPGIFQALLFRTYFQGTEKKFSILLAIKTLHFSQ